MVAATREARRSVLQRPNVAYALTCVDAIGRAPTASSREPGAAANSWVKLG